MKNIKVEIANDLLSMTEQISKHYKNIFKEPSYEFACFLDAVKGYAHGLLVNEDEDKNDTE